MTAAARYATALFQLAAQHKSLPAVIAPAAALAEAVTDADIAAVLANPRLSNSQRAAFAKTMARAVQAPALLANTLNLMANNNRLALLPAMLASLQTQADAASGLIRVQLQTAQPFTPEQTATLQAKIKTFTKAAAVEVEESLQPALIGGFRAIFAGQVWDQSLTGKLSRLKSNLAQRSA